ncbi:MAG TPA: hypothetical protein VGV93_13800 [Acidimicrobiales bacterium]|nr:hypothetical protein [Acidimicrobiales bacterium]
MTARSTAVRAVARAVVAVVPAVGIWMFLYAIGENTAPAGQLVVAVPVVVLALLLYEASGRWRWRRQADGNQEPEQVARKIARAVVATLVAAGVWAGVYAYAVDLSRNTWLGAAIVFVGPPVVGLASLIYLKLLRRRRA